MEHQIQQAIGRAFGELQDSVLRREFRDMNSRLDTTDRKLDNAVYKVDNTDSTMRREFQRVFQRIGSRMDNADRKLDNTAQNLDRTETFVREEFQRIGSRMDHTDKKLDNTAHQLDRAETFMRQEFERVGSRMDRTDSKLDSTDRKLDMTAQKLDMTAQKLDQTDAFMRQEFERASARMDRTDSKLDMTALKLDRTEAFMRQEFQKAGSRMDNTDGKLDSSAQRLDDLTSRITTLDVMMRNSKIVFLSQKIHPLPAYDVATQQPLPIPDVFPSTALKLYNLQYRKNCMLSLDSKILSPNGTNILEGRKLKNILLYYHLEPELIELFRFSNNLATSSGLDTDSDSGSESHPKPTEGDLSSAIESNAWGAVSILAAHLGVDYDTLHDRVVQFEFQQKKRAGQKRHPEGGIEAETQMKRIVPMAGSSEDGSWRRRVNEAAAQSPKATPPVGEGGASDGKNTMLNWKNDSGEVRGHYRDMGYAHINLKSPGRTSASDRARSHHSSPGTPSTREIPSSEIQQRLD